MPADLPPFARSTRPVDDAASDVYDDGRLRVEHDNYYAACGGEAIKFPRTEFLLFSRLTHSMSRIVKAEELWRCAWGDSKPYNAESLHVHIYRLRNKLTPFGIQIETMVNVGYRLLTEANARHLTHESIKDESASGRRATS